MQMYERIENIVVRTLSPIEYETLEHLSKTYSEDEIVNTYKTCGDKPITYIQKVLQSKPRKVIPDWLRGEVVNQEIDDETEHLFDDFKLFLEDFRNEKSDKKNQDEN